MNKIFQVVIAFFKRVAGILSFNFFMTSVLKYLVLYLIVLFIFFISRATILLTFGVAQDLYSFHRDIVRAFITGLRYDTVVFSYLFLPVFVLICIPINRDIYKAIFKKFILWYSAAALFILVWLQIGDFYFFKFFQTHFSLLAFGIIYDDTMAVLDSVWKDYPVIRILIFFIMVFGCLIWILRKFSARVFSFKINHLHAVFKVAVVITVILLQMLALRGSLGVFPLEKDDATISPNSFVNQLTMNGIFALKDAYADNRKNTITTDSLAILNKYWYHSKKEALSDFGTLRPCSCSTALLDTTDYNEVLEKNPPNVIFILMESWAGYYFDLNAPRVNLLGSLEKELPHSYLFRNFTSCANGTVHSLEGLIVNSPLTPLSQSVYMNKPLPSSIAKVFNDKGYKTSFITGAKLGWRNLGNYVSVQGFQQIEGMSDLLSRIPKAETCEWGVYDEFLFERVYQQLAESRNKPLFAFVFTTTNHTPYQLPEKYSPLPISIPDFIREDQRSDDEIVMKNLTAFQYSNHYLGKLLERIRNSEFGNRTIVVVTGDHNSLALYNFTDKQLLQKYSVPLLFYIPERYKPAFVDVSRFGSHKDVFPTIFNLSLSRAVYYNTGSNLFSKNTDQKFYAINDYKTAFCKNGAVVLGKNPLYYKFNTRNELVQSNLTETPELISLEKYCRSHTAVQSLFIQEQLLP